MAVRVDARTTLGPVCGINFHQRTVRGIAGVKLAERDGAEGGANGLTRGYNGAVLAGCRQARCGGPRLSDGLRRWGERDSL